MPLRLADDQNQYITILLRYKPEDVLPQFRAGMTVYGGDVIAVSFYDMFQEKQDLKEGE